MKQRGRKSTASLSVVGGGVAGNLPEPPAELSEREAAVWNSVVSTKPSDWFDEDTFPLLSDYCRHTVRQDDISRMINKFDSAPCDSDELRVFDNLLRMSERETRAKMSLATKMRITQQSKYGARQAEAKDRRGGGHKRPWQFGKD